MRFNSEVDSLFYIALIACIAGAAVAIAPSLQAPSLSEYFSAGLMVLVVAVLPVWLLLTTYYVVEGDSLKVHSGPFRWSIALHEIRSVMPSKSVLASPALSLDRLKIVYGDGRRILVSPKNRDAFLTAIGQSASNA